MRNKAICSIILRVDFLEREYNMNKRFYTMVKRCIALCCAVAFCSVSIIAYADEDVNTLEQKTNELQNQLDKLNDELNILSDEITALTSQIDESNSALEKAALDLEAAKLNEQIQYDAMKQRIKYMYENGNTSFLHMIFSSESMADFLNNTAFVQNITEYDRKMLLEFQDSRTNVEEREAELQQKQEHLVELQDSLNARYQELNDAIASTSGDLQVSSDALAKAKAAQEAANTAANNNTGNANSSSSSSNTASGSSPEDSTEVSSSDLVLLAAILQCEAGSSNYDALLAVATVIMNRVASSKYPNTVYGVIYQSGQFSPTWNGSLKRVLSRGPASLCYQAAQDALNGSRLSSVSGCYSFRSSSTGHYGTLVGGNVFF